MRQQHLSPFPTFALLVRTQLSIRVILQICQVSSLLTAPHFSKFTSLRVKTKDLQWSKTQCDLAFGYISYLTSIFKFACSLQPHQQPHSFSNVPASVPLHLPSWCTCPLTSNTLLLDSHIVNIFMTFWPLLHSYLVSENLPPHITKLQLPAKIHLKSFYSA